MNQPKAPRYFIGLDAGVNCGVAVWNVAGERFDRLETLDFWRAFETVLTFDPSEVIIIIEDPSQNAPLFDKGVRGARKRERLAQTVGGVKRESTLLADGLARKGYRVRRIRPRTRKLGADTFRRLTKHQGRTSQHARDAGMLVYGLRNIPAELDQSAGALSLALYAPPSS